MRPRRCPHAGAHRGARGAVAEGAGVRRLRGLQPALRRATSRASSRRFWSLAARARSPHPASRRTSPTPGATASTWSSTRRTSPPSFALGLRAGDATRPTGGRSGLPAGSRIRIGLHAGPVFRGFDPGDRPRQLSSARACTRAARIEPVTPPGTVFTRARPSPRRWPQRRARSSCLEYVGRVGLAKGYGEARVYRLARR
ncbi:MAG: hypothetical protein MZW92_67525 [Comamonadaceae bacterium]|nr:hypothetical protein [Comamonadaceae bacterium]